ncbi:hypothetical protein EVAR_50915_1 [Eumeta japonica]|uniref:Uncharacterized protein n=1 Tax=Eumeta variegata TaxID=151549 RepID=A0A4C1Y526_EUMVA|nr:hypothetical protein EVAR_50915_1 [Eumeta japonica]
MEQNDKCLGNFAERNIELIHRLRWRRRPCGRRRTRRREECSLPIKLASADIAYASSMFKTSTLVSRASPVQFVCIFLCTGSAAGRTAGGPRNGSPSCGEPSSSPFRGDRHCALRRSPSALRGPAQLASPALPPLRCATPFQIFEIMRPPIYIVVKAYQISRARLKSLKKSHRWHYCLIP